MLSSSLDTLLKLSKTSSPQKLFAKDCVTLYECCTIICSKIYLFCKHWSVEQNYIAVPVDLYWSIISVWLKTNLPNLCNPG